VAITKAIWHPQKTQLKALNTLVLGMLHNFIDFSFPDCTLSSSSINFINQDQQGHTSTATPNQHPVIIDSGVSLAITPFYNDFIEPLTLPPGNLILGGVANGLKIEGTGLSHCRTRCSFYLQYG
jgi:hypothetical protein